MPNWAAYEEANKRGILPPEKKALYEEAMGRGLAPAPEGGTPPISTITGKPIPTMNEAYQQNLKMYKGLLPIAGDIAATFVAPQIKGPMMAGKALNLLIRGGASAVGSGVGELAGQKLTGGELDLEGIKKEAALGFGGEVGLSLLGAPAKWVAKKVAEPTAKLLSMFTASSMKVTQAMKNRMVKRTTERALKFVEDLAPDVVKRQDVNLGSLGAMVESAVSEKRAMYDFYENILRKHAEKKGGFIELPQTMTFLEEQRNIIKEISGEALTRVQVNKQLASRMNYPGLHNDFKALIDTWKPTGTKSYLDEMGIEVDPEVITNLLATVFKPGGRGKKGFHDLGSKQLKNLRTKFKESLLDDISNIQGKVEGKTALQAKQEADEMTKALAQFQFIKRLYDQSTSVGKFSTDLRLAPNQIADKIYANKTKIEKQMPELWPKLKAEADYYKSVADNFSQTGFQKSDFLRGVGTAVGWGAAGPWGVPIVEGMGAASAYFLMSPKGRKVLQKIVYGSVKGAGKAGVHIGGRQVEFSDPGAF